MCFPQKNVILLQNASIFIHLFIYLFITTKCWLNQCLVWPKKEYEKVTKPISSRLVKNSRSYNRGIRNNSVKFLDRNLVIDEMKNKSKMEMLGCRRTLNGPNWPWQTCEKWRSIEALSAEVRQYQQKSSVNLWYTNRLRISSASDKHVHVGGLWVWSIKRSIQWAFDI